MRDRWEHFAHGADIGVRGIGATKADAFEQAALALTAVVTDPGPWRRASRSPSRARRRTTNCCWPTGSMRSSTRWRCGACSSAASRCDLDGHRLDAQARGEPASVERHQPAVEVKGATYTALRVARRDDGGWLAQTVVDV